jgi:hypothetical protein
MNHHLFAFSGYFLHECMAIARTARLFLRINYENPTLLPISPDADKSLFGGFF